METHRLQKELYTRIDQLPTLPTVLPKLMELAEDPRSSAADITKAISQDPALTAKVLTVANSAYYGFSKTIASLDRAVPLLGINTVKSLALAVGVVRCLPAAKDSAQFPRERLWIHSLAVATAMDKLGGMTGFDTNYLFTVGLLHDLGIIALDQFFHDQFIGALELVRSDPEMSLPQAENKVIGFDHGQVGGFLLARWKFPEVIMLPIRAHHMPQPPTKTSHVDLCLLRLADSIAHEIEWAAYEGPPSYPELAEHIEYLGLSPDQLLEAREFLAGKRDEIASFYQAMG